MCPNFIQNQLFQTSITYLPWGSKTLSLSSPCTCPADLLGLRFIKVPINKRREEDTADKTGILHISLLITVAVGIHEHWVQDSPWMTKPRDAHVPYII